jgi:hypothetical protein
MWEALKEMGYSAAPSAGWPKNSVARLAPWQLMKCTRGSRTLAGQSDEFGGTVTTFFAFWKICRTESLVERIQTCAVTAK